MIWYFCIIYKFVLVVGVGCYVVIIECFDNSNDVNVVILMVIYVVNVCENVVYLEDMIVCIMIKGLNDSNSNCEQKYNMLVQWYIISYDWIIGGVDYILWLSCLFVDVILYEWVVVGKQDVVSIDVVVFYVIVDLLLDVQFGYFDYIFLDEKQFFGECIVMIVNVV